MESSTLTGTVTLPTVTTTKALRGRFDDGVLGGVPVTPRAFHPPGTLPAAHIRLLVGALHMGDAHAVTHPAEMVEQGGQNQLNLPCDTVGFADPAILEKSVPFLIVGTEPDIATPQVRALDRSGSVSVYLAPKAVFSTCFVPSAKPGGFHARNDTGSG